jgi:tetratricopeptide (TPR) repeat protein
VIAIRDRSRLAARRRGTLTSLLGLVLPPIALLALLFVAGCATFGQPGRDEFVDPIRVSDAAQTGDPARRASIRLVLQGLDADTDGHTERAQGSYERAIQVDPTNPYAYLALARHYLDGYQAERALPLLDQAAALFEAEGMREPRVGVHLIGLRGRAMHASGQAADAIIYLDRAAELAPRIWGDGYLAPEELR